MFSKILYIGAGEDSTPLELFPRANFVFVDSLPRNEYGYDYYYRGFYKDQFKEHIIKQLAKLQFVKTDEKIYSAMYSEINVPDLEPHRLTFQKGHQQLDYYFSTSIPHNLYIEDKPHSDLLTAISECDTIFISGHWPHETLLDYLKSPFRIIFATGTYFPENRKDHEENDDKKSILWHLIEDTTGIVSSYSYLCSKGTIHTFPSYANFYKYYKSNQK